MTHSHIKMVTFSGVDGAGKTTILRNCVEILEKKFQLNVVEIRHRPSILPILSSLKYGKKAAEIRTTEALPRTGQNSSKVSSYFRFFYYLSDYILGQWVNYFKYTRRGVLIVYDRYYFDFIVDARRTNIDLDKSFLRFFYRFVIEPDINIFLYADSEVILSRKQELDARSIDELTREYKRLFSTLSERYPGRYVCIENNEIVDTLDQIQAIYREFRK